MTENKTYSRFQTSFIKKKNCQNHIKWAQWTIHSEFFLKYKALLNFWKRRRIYSPTFPASNDTHITILPKIIIDVMQVEPRENPFFNNSFSMRKWEIFLKQRIFIFQFYTCEPTLNALHQIIFFFLGGGETVPFKHSYLSFKALQCTQVSFGGNYI